jgi:hypothetical protein
MAAGRRATRTLLADPRPLNFFTGGKLRPLSRPNGPICGVTLIVELGRVDDVTADQDPIVFAVRRSLSGALRGADGVSLMSRFTLPEGDPREAKPAMNALQICHFVGK